MSSIAFITTCKGRLDHLKQTLPLLVAQKPDEVIVVDYGCPQGAGDWVTANFPAVKLVRVTDDAGFRAGRARNMGAAVAKSEWLGFIDADIKVAPGFVDWLRQNLHQAFHWRAARQPDGEREKNSWGSFLCHRAAFEALGGYDEVYDSWGGEDDDLYARLALLGLPENSFPLELVEPIRHEDALRFTYSTLKDKRSLLLATHTFRELKTMMQLGRVKAQANELSTDSKKALLQRVFRGVRSLADTADSQVPLGKFEVNSILRFEEGDLAVHALFTCELRRKAKVAATAPPASAP